MMNVYLSKRYEFNDDLIGIELVLINGVNDIKYEIVHKNNFHKINEKYGNCGKDFEVTIDIRIEGARNVKTIVLLSKTSMRPEACLKRDSIESFYDLLVNLAEFNCLYLGIPESMEDTNDSYFPSFGNIRVSNSTMTICIPVYSKTTGTWKSKVLISSNDDGSLEQKEFYCAIPREVSHKFLTFGLELIKEINVNNLPYSVFRYSRNLPVCSSTNDFNFCNPLVCHFVYTSYVYKNIITGLKALQRLLLEDKVREEFERSSKFVKPTSRRGVYFECLDKNITRDDAEMHASKIASLVRYSMQNNLEIDYPKVAINYAEKSKLSRIWLPVVNVLLRTVKYEEELTLDTLERATLSLADYNKLYLQNELFLYNLRVSCIKNPKVFLHQGISAVNSFEIFGSSYQNIVRVKRL